jgi:hypothetical protein
MWLYVRKIVFEAWQSIGKIEIMIIATYPGGPWVAPTVNFALGIIPGIDYNETLMLST